MGILSDLQIRDWIKRGEHFEGKGDGDTDVTNVSLIGEIEASDSS